LHIKHKSKIEQNNKNHTHVHISIVPNYAPWRRGLSNCQTDPNTAENLVIAGPTHRLSLQNNS